MNNLPIRCYDNLGETADRYTVIFLNQFSRNVSNGALFRSLGMSHNPCHPQGVGMHEECIYPNEFIGEEIQFEDLPDKCQELVMEDLNEHKR